MNLTSNITDEVSNGINKTYTKLPKTEPEDLGKIRNMDTAPLFLVILYVVSENLITKSRTEQLACLIDI